MATSPLTFYPAFCHPSSPTYFTWVKIAAIDVHRLQARSGFECQNLYFHLNHPIQFIHLAGVIISRDEQTTRTILILDDSSGETIEVVCPKPAANTAQDATAATSSGSAPSSHQTSATSTFIDISALQPFTCAKVKGTIRSFRGVKQVSLERFTIVKTMEEEMRFWEERSRFLVDVLSVPWEVEEVEVGRLRVKAESGDGDARGGDGKKGGRDRDRGMGKEAERKRRREEGEEKDRLRIEKRYAREEQVRHKLAMRCRAASASAVTIAPKKRQ